jgi:hypothetical protein
LTENERGKIRRWNSAGCALALAALCISPTLFSPVSASAQSAATQDRAPTTGTTSKAAGAKPHTKAAAKDTTASHATSSAKADASHSAAGKHASTATAARSSKAKPVTSRTKGNKASRKKTARGQQKIDSDRAQAIQEALIREHYLSGEAAGTWNQASEDAMRRYQADHGWQSKTVPDARALISLGLGPNHDHLLNPESAMTTEPPTTHAASLDPASHSADPGARLSSPATDPAATRTADGGQSSPQ